MAKTNAPMPTVKLNDGHSFPMSSDDGKIDRALVDSIKTAIKMGYHHLDGAEVYKTEPELGLAIKESGVAREDLFITTKVLPSIKDIPNAIKTSLKKLQLDYVDLYLIHTPFFASSPADLQAAWAAMESIQQAGLARSIGVSNFRPVDLDAVFEKATIPPAVNQIEFHPYLQQPQVQEYHRERGIVTAAYGPLTPVTKAKGGPLDDFLAGVAKKYAVGEAEVLLRWCIDQDVVPITTSGKEQRLSDCLRAMTFKLTPAEVKRINELGAQKHVRGFWSTRFQD